MTAPMDIRAELMAIQNELKKYIYHHTMLTIRLDKKSNENVKSKLALFEKKIKQLDDRQKLVVYNYRKEQYEALSSNSHNLHNQSNLLKPKNNTGILNQHDKQLAQLRSLNNKKLLIPVSAATATSKKTNQQILVVPTPDGGARLATSTNNTSRSTLSKSSFTKNSNGFASNSLLSSSHKPNQFNNFTINSTTKSISTLPKNQSNLIGLKRTINSSATTSTTNSLLPSNEVLNSLSSSNKRKQPLSQQIIIDRSSSSSSSREIPVKPETKIDEAKVKEEFFSKLGLVTKQALSEIQNKKSERKRRTTANPQFSNAAIEAKRITAQELAAKKANRKRELAASNQDNLINSNASASNKRSFLNSNRGKQVVGGKQQQEAASKRNLPKASNKQQLNQSSEIKISSNCFVCDEICDSDLDEIMFCEDCQCLFHATCSSTIDSIKKTMGVPCPKCERKRSLADDNFNDNSNESNILKQKSHHDSSNSNSSSVGGKSAFRRKLENNKASKKVNARLNEQSNRQQSKGKGETLESKLDDERYESLVRYQTLDRQVRDFKVKLALLRDKVYVSKENRREMLVKKENSKREIESIINLVKMIQELENSEHKENQINQQDSTDMVAEDVVIETAGELIINESVQEQQIVESSQNEVLTKDNEETVKNEIKPQLVENNSTMIDEANEAVNNLNNLDALASLAVDEMNKLAAAQVENQPIIDIEINNLEIEVKEEQIETEMIIEPQPNELVPSIELVNSVKVSLESNSTNSNNELCNNNESLTSNKAQSSPEQVIVESIEESLVENMIEQVEEELISQDLDEVSAAIASIPT